MGHSRYKFAQGWQVQLVFLGACQATPETQSFVTEPLSVR